MPLEAVSCSPAALDRFVAAYEEARAQDRHADLRRFLPEPGHPLYRRALTELIRVELELDWQGGRGKRLEAYLHDFPELEQAPEVLEAIAYEEYRLRQVAGDNPAPEEYRRRFDVAVDGWPGRPTSVEVSTAGANGESAASPLPRYSRHPLLGSLNGSSSPPGLVQAALAYREFCLQAKAGESEAIDKWGASVQSSPEYVQLFRDVHHSEPTVAQRLAKALTTLPEAGQDFLGFQLVEVLGQGAFGRVYLARQGELADRYVALKVATDVVGESQTLAQLQHTNIVPIHSIHRADPFQAVCMPYLGSTTLADVLDEVNSQKALPDSGKILVSTLNDRKASTRRTGSSKAVSAPAPAVPVEPTAEAPTGVPVAAESGDATGTLQKLQASTYVEAVLWMAARLADGLAHAHERGILHRDLKPANVLLTEDGQPMLLDFNLSEDTKVHGGAAAVSIGGTLPYMAPEHLEAFCGQQCAVDTRSDLYSLGVVLFELLTAQQPFVCFPGVTKAALERMIEKRRTTIPQVRRANPAVTPAVESIVRHCLEPDPAQRYQTARELLEDLERQLHDQPLRFAPEPSLRERAGKWVRRHPRLTSLTSVGTIAAVLLVVLTTGFVVRGRLVARQEAKDKLAVLHEDLRTGEFLLCARDIQREELAEGAGVCRSALDRYQVLDNPQWQESATVRHLAPEEQNQLRAEVGKLLLLLAHASSKLALFQTEDRNRWHEEIQQAWRYNQLVQENTGANQSSRAFWLQRADLAELLGNRTEAKRAREEGKNASPQTVRDLYLTAHEYAQEGRWREALPLLQDATHRDPQNFPAWAVLGNCHDALSQEAEAVACYNACIALRPTSYTAWYNRGLIRLKQRFYELARSDFDRVISLRTDLADAYINRALAQEGLGKFAEAIKDLTEALRRGTPRTRVYFMRAYAKAKAGDKAGAQQDTAAGLRLEPADEKSWIVRGLARIDTDPQGALADFEKALELNPRSVDALQNKAHVLGERLGRAEDAIRALDVAVAQNPDFVPARAGRGVYLARLGKRPAAEQDAREALLRDVKPPNLYQVACIYALNSRQNADDRVQAFHLLSLALRSGFGLDLVAEDRDLDPLRDRPEFRRVVEAARALQAEGRPKSTP
jgi:serine/threonine protein kinase/Tfp pilus assembly protein PilF